MTIKVENINFPIEFDEIHLQYRKSVTSINWWEISFWKGGKKLAWNRVEEMSISAVGTLNTKLVASDY